MGKSPKKTLLLIRGKGHSGTTILDLVLSCHSRIAGIGEGMRDLRVLHQSFPTPPPTWSSVRHRGR
jgi:hypothetical protein